MGPVQPSIRLAQVEATWFPIWPYIHACCWANRTNVECVLVGDASSARAIKNLKPWAQDLQMRFLQNGVNQRWITRNKNHLRPCDICVCVCVLCSIYSCGPMFNVNSPSSIEAQFECLVSSTFEGWWAQCTTWRVMSKTGLRQNVYLLLALYILLSCVDLENAHRYYFGWSPPTQNWSQNLCTMLHASNMCSINLCMFFQLLSSILLACALAQSSVL